ncbi:MAG: PBP1A family penicillin-binding protein [Armatimonadetes bacterium]|nr:PBP1A family penicillin-binding protein [Armatimonadota bacterium]
MAQRERALKGVAPRTGKRRRKKKALWKRILAAFALLVLSLVVVGVTFVAVVIHNTSKLLPSIEAIQSFQPSGSTKILSSDGTVMGELSDEKREPALLGDMPQNLINATIAKEDKRFWEHKGVDARGTARALWVNVTGGRLQQGGSTITQQLARNIFLSQERTLNRKVQEILLATEIERNRTKEQILELYLNQVYYGNRAYGVKSAARTYFNKDLKDLTLSECAMLAAMPQRPSGYDPYVYPEEAKRQRNIVLNLMAEQSLITTAQRDAAKAEPLRLAKNPKGSHGFRAPYAVMDILRDLEDEFSREFLYRDLRVQSTIDMAMQTAAENALSKGIAKHAGKGVTQGAVVLIDLKTGYIRALVGGRNFRESQYNAITQGRRPPGSSFKPLVYAVAFEHEKLSPSSRLVDAPVSYPGAAGKPWKPRNANGKFSGSVSVESAIIHSINIPAIKAMELVGARTVAEEARIKFGIESPLDPVLPLALGANAVKPIELAQAYSVFANKGVMVRPRLIVDVQDREGTAILATENRQRQAISEQSAEWMDDILRKVVTRGTATAASKIPEARGKTGTTNDYRDAWFVGYTPRYIAVVWVSSAQYNAKSKRWDYLPMKRVFGGVVCAAIWADLMNDVIAIDAKRKTTEKPDEKVVIESGEPPSPRVQEAPLDEPREEQPPSNDWQFYPPSTAPNAPSEPTLERTTRTRPAEPRETAAGPRAAMPDEPEPMINVRICADTGQRATEYCPESIARSMTADAAPRRSCSRHRPPH